MTGRECDHIQEIWLEQALGRALPAQKLAIIDGHLAECRACRAEHRLTEALRFDGSSGPAPELDDLARRRWIDQVMERMPRAGSVVATEPEAGTGAVIVPLRLKFTMGLAAAAALAVVLGIQFADFSSGGLAPGSGAPAVVARAPQLAQNALLPSPAASNVLLAAGEVSVDGKTVEGAPVPYGSPIVTGDGHAVIDAPNDVRLFVAPGSRLQLAAATADSQPIILSSGKLVSEVSPRRLGPPLVVSTQFGDVVVTGTVFSIEVSEDDVAVQVFRGSVLLQPAQGGASSLSFGQGAYLRAGDAWSVAESERMEIASVLRTFEILTHEDSSRLEIGSAPAGAEVLLNGISVGKTPLFAAVREGSRSLEVAMQDYAPVREMIHLKPSAHTVREFELLEAKAGKPAAPAVQKRARRALARSSVKTANPKAVVDPRETVDESAELLAIAQSFRASKNWWQAQAHYQELITRFPKSAEARAAKVSLGTILLENLNKPAQALNAFESYLAVSSRGVLAQEAAYGRAQALRRLGRHSRELVALRDFLARFPSSLQAERVKKRLKELQTL